MRNILIIPLFLFAVTSFAASLKITNRTGLPIRVAELYSSCGDVIVHRDSPHHLEDGESMLAPEIKIVMHHYKICGNGACILTAMGIKDDIDYQLAVELDDELITGVPLPDHWVGNTQCALSEVVE
ncbi:MAG TPA: hypothetical protein VNJ01_00910 [Bacteriovoracaceae bacterium]|nr:hypothetical protein [Bacteriovoracaceae bacterium]